MRKLSAILGLSAIALFLGSLVSFASLTPGFDIVNDAVSLLGAAGQPYGTAWNVIGFVLVGFLLSGFGVVYGLSIQDPLVSLFLGLFGLACACIALPVQLDQPEALQTNIHIEIVCVCMAFWCFGLARLQAKGAMDNALTRYASVVAVVAIVLSSVGQAIELLSIAHFQRLFFGGIFCWIVSVSISTLRQQQSSSHIEIER
ncbi:MAG: DUF998 domain-containing protein [Pseudomonadota bacterium]